MPFTLDACGFRHCRVHLLGDLVTLDTLLKDVYGRRPRGLGCPTRTTPVAGFKSGNALQQMTPTRQLPIALLAPTTSTGHE